MGTENLALSHALQKIYYKFVKNLVDNNVSLDDILKELKIVGLEGTKTNAKNVEDYIQRRLARQWNEKEKRWKDEGQIGGLDNKYNSDNGISMDYSVLTLSENDTRTILKDMKEILSGVKRITNGINKAVEDISRIANDIDNVVKDINKIVAEIKPKNEQ